MKLNECLNKYKTEKRFTVVPEYFQWFKLPVLAREGIVHNLISLVEKLFFISSLNTWTEAILITVSADQKDFFFFQDWYIQQ